MPYLCPQTLTADEQKLILGVTAKHLSLPQTSSALNDKSLRLLSILGPSARIPAFLRTRRAHGEWCKNSAA